MVLELMDRLLTEMWVIAYPWSLETLGKNGSSLNNLSVSKKITFILNYTFRVYILLFSDYSLQAGNKKIFYEWNKPLLKFNDANQNLFYLKEFRTKSWSV